MPLNRRTTKTFHRHLFAGILQTVTFHKRGDDLKQGTVTRYLLFNCRQSLITKTRETIQRDMLADHRCTWHIPRTELERVGIHYINNCDFITDEVSFDGSPRVWQPEATTPIVIKLFENEIDVDCLLANPSILIPNDRGYPANG